jgi:hypothetical protein
MISDPSRQTSGILYDRDPWPEIARRYPSITTADGRIYFVDRHGLIAGLIPWENNRGRRRCDYPAEPPETLDIMAAVWWIRHRDLRPQKTPTLGSYRGKHLAEKWRNDYVSNGALIIAFARLGFPQYVDPSGWDQLNTTIGVSRRSYKHLPEATRFELGRDERLNWPEVAR